MKDEVQVTMSPTTTVLALQLLCNSGYHKIFHVLIRSRNIGADIKWRSAYKVNISCPPVVTKKEQPNKSKILSTVVIIYVSLYLSRVSKYQYKWLTTIL